MKIGSTNTNLYVQDIHKHIFRYAYENAEIGKLLTESTVEWFGEIFKTDNILDELHKDIIFYLKKEKLYLDIVNTTDKFIVLPDVFSERTMPNSFFNLNEVDENGIKDYGNGNIVILNGKVFELIDRKIHSIKFCYSGKLYYFYDSSNPISKYIESEEPSMRVLNTYRYSEFDYSEKYPVGHKLEGTYMFQLDFNNNVVSGETSEDYLTIQVNYPYAEYNYIEEDILDKSPIVGLFSVNPNDVFIQEKIYDEREEKFIIHNRSQVFTQTLIVFYKDKTYEIINDSTSDFFFRLDKHTIEFQRSAKVEKVVAFYKPIYFDPTIERVDSLYDDVMKVSNYGFYELRYYHKNTDYLYNWIVNKNPSVEELVEYGYKYDLDVLYAIQKAFPMWRTLNETSFYVAKTDNAIRASKQNQLFVTVPNMLNLIPVLFIDGIMYPHDTRCTAISPDMNSLHLNITRWNPDLNNILKNSSNPEVSIREYFKNKDVKVIYMSYIATSETSITYPKEYKPLLDKSTPMTIISRSELMDNDQAIFFANGRHWNPSCNSPFMYKQFVYDIGMGDDSKVLSLLNRVIDDNKSINKLNLVTPSCSFTYSDSNCGVFEHRYMFSENATISFDTTGKLNVKDINVLDVHHVVLNDSFKVMNGCTPTVTIVRLPRVNNLYDLDFEVDYSRVDQYFNAGSFNDKVIERNPDILRFFYRDGNFLIENPPKLIEHNKAKIIGDLVSTFGSCTNTPFNPKDYRIFLMKNDVDVVNHYDFIPIDENIPEDCKQYFKPYNLASKIISNIAARFDISKNYMKPTVFTAEDIDIEEFPPQLQYYLNRGIILGSEVKFIPLDIDLEFIYTDDFNNPVDNDPSIHLRIAALTMNLAYDKAAVNSTVTMPTQTLNLGGDDE